MATDTERLVLRLEASLAQFERELKRGTQVAAREARKIESQFAQMNTRLGRSFSGLGRTIAAGIGIAGIGSLGRAITQVGANAENLVNVADRLGITTSALQELHHAAEETDVGVEGMNDALDQFAKRIGDAASGTGELKDILEANGIALRDNQGNMRPLLDLFNDYSDLIQRAGDATQRADLATAGFGRGQKEMINLTSQGSEGLRRFAEEARRLGLVLEEHQVRRMADVNDAWQRFTRLISTEFQSTVMQIVTGFEDGQGGIERFQEAVKNLFDFIRDNMHWLDNLVGAMAGAKALGVFGPTGRVVGAVGGAIAPELGGIRGAVQDFTAGKLAEQREADRERLRTQQIELKRQEDTVVFSLAKIRELNAEREQALARMQQLGPMASQEAIQAEINKLTEEIAGFENAAKTASERVDALTTSNAGLQAKLDDVTSAANMAAAAVAGVAEAAGTAPAAGGLSINTVDGRPVTPVTSTASPTRPVLTERPDLSSYLRSGQARSHVERLDREFADALEKMFQEAPETVRAATTINSGFRTFERQAELFEEAIRKYGSRQAARKWVAEPGRSQHNMGNAADLGFQTNEARQWFHQNAGRFGLGFPMGHEPWHIQGVAGAERTADEDFRSAYEERQQAQVRAAEAVAQARKEAADDAKRLQDAIDGVTGATVQEIATLQAELTAIGLSTYEREKMLKTLELENQYRAAGVVNLEQYRDIINQQAEAYANLAVQTETAAKAQEDAQRSTQAAQEAMVNAVRDAQASMAETGQFLSGVTKGIISDLIAGKSAAEAMGNALSKIGDRLIDLALNQMFGSLFGTGGGAPGLLGGGGGVGGLLAGLFGGRRAMGGPVSAGRSYLVGEHRPEIFVPNVAGRIQPNAAGGTARVEVLIRRGEMFEPYVVKTSGQVSARVSHTAITESQDRQRRRN